MSRVQDLQDEHVQEIKSIGMQLAKLSRTSGSDLFEIRQQLHDIVRYTRSHSETNKEVIEVY